MPTATRSTRAHRRPSRDAAADRGRAHAPAARRTPSACGDFAVNTMQPAYPAVRAGTAPRAGCRRRRTPTIGDRLSAAGVDWAWYSGGWSNANGDVGGPGWTNGSRPAACARTRPIRARGDGLWPNCPDKLFQYHHQPFNYFADYAPGTAGPRRAPARRGGVHRRRAARGRAAPAAGQLRQAERRRERAPRLRQRAEGSDHLVDLLKAIERGALRQGHDGRRDLRRVRRPVGPRPAARPGRQRRARTTPGVPARASRR